MMAFHNFKTAYKPSKTMHNTHLHGLAPLYPFLGRRK